ncbi:MAG: YesL family protein, partial [Oscillospiraceae bacterium]|nr:YesL family protein [Oscillospiraceae bacterium]
MSIFYNPQKSGSGVAKNAGEKRPFFKFFELFGRKFWNLILLNLIYIMFCLPVVTIGPATAALTHIMRKFVLEQPIFMFSEFVSAFKKNFRQSLAVGIIDVAFILLFFNALLFFGAKTAQEPVRDNYVMLAMTMVSGAIFMTVNFYIYPQIVCLRLKLPAIVKNAALLGIVGLKRNIITLAVFVGVISLIAFTLPVS